MKNERVFNGKKLAMYLFYVILSVPNIVHKFLK